MVRFARLTSSCCAAILIAASCSGGSSTAPATPSTVAILAGNNQTATVGQALPQALVLAVHDQSGAGVAGVTVAWSIRAGGGTLSPTTSQTDGQGQAQASWTLGTKAGLDTAIASVTGLSGPVIFTAIADVGPAAQLSKLAGDSQTGSVGLMLPQPLVVAARDQYGNGVGGLSVTWNVIAGGGSLSAVLVTTNAQGLAAVDWTLGPGVGTRTDSAQAVVSGLAGSPATFWASGVTTAVATVYTDTATFRQATSGLGAPVRVAFDDVDSTPINNTIFGRTPFDGTHYAATGFTFASPGGYALYIAPGGLSWNASNSLAIGHFPFDTTHAAPTNDADSLAVTLNPDCQAVAFQLVDNNTRSANEFVRFLDDSGRVVAQAGLPPNYGPNRAFIGVVSSTAVARILVAENANDGDDVDYDDFACFP